MYSSDTKNSYHYKIYTIFAPLIQNLIDIEQRYLTILIKTLIKQTVVLTKL